MTLGNRIAYYRKTLNITQDTLAQQLGVTNQAVSKWESDQCCPDVMLLPKMADIFSVTTDDLFGREARTEASAVTSLPWPDDGTLRAVVFIGHQLIANSPAAKEFTFSYEGPALNVSSAFGIACGDIGGNVYAGGGVACNNVEGDVNAGRGVACNNIEGNVDAGGKVACNNVGGDVNAGSDVECTYVEGNIDAGGSVTIRK